jgi:uroporphyrinogen decarboxylase
MNSKERVHAIFSGGRPDRVARYEQSIYSSVSSAILGRKAFTGGTSLHWEEARAWTAGGKRAHEELVDRVYRDCAELYTKLGFDIIGRPWLMAAEPAKKVSEYEFLYGEPDGDWSLCRYDPVSETFGTVDSSAKHETIGDLEKQVAEMEKTPEGEPEDEPIHVVYLRRLLKEFGDTHAVPGGAGLSIPLTEPWLMACATDPGLVGAYLDAAVEGQIAEIGRQAALGIKILWAGGDFADNTGPVYGPRVFRELMLPRLKRLMAEVHRLGMWYVYRSDGKLWTVTDMMFEEAGCDAYGEIDWAAGMDLAELKKRYPKVTFWGNVPPPLIRNGSKNDVLAAAKHCIDAVSDKRLILGSSNSILPGTPPENVYALSEAVQRWG